MPVAVTPPPGAPGLGADTAWREFRERLRAFVARRVSNGADVDDVVQQVFLQMHRSLADIRSGERIHAWLYSTARRAIVDHYRSAPRRREVPAGDSLDLDALRAGADVPWSDDGHDAPPEAASCLAPMMERLTPADREAIALIEVQGLRLAEAAARAGLSLSGMKSRVQRARRRLRQAILDCCHLALDARGRPTSCVKREEGGPRCARPAS